MYYKSIIHNASQQKMENVNVIQTEETEYEEEEIKVLLWYILKAKDEG